MPQQKTDQKKIGMLQRIEDDHRKETNKSMRAGDDIIKSLSPVLPQSIRLKLVRESRGYDSPRISIEVRGLPISFGPMELCAFQLEPTSVAPQLLHHIMEHLSYASIDRACDRIGHAMKSMARQ